jgi:hypothetical protein
VLGHLAAYLLSRLIFETMAGRFVCSELIKTEKGHPMRSVFVSFALCSFLLAPSFSSAQTKSDAQELIHFLNESNRLVYRSTETLGQMSNLLEGVEKTAVMELPTSAVLHYTAVNEVVLLATIYSVMIDDRDKKFVQWNLMNYLPVAVTTAKESVARINELLPVIHSQALIIETQKLRDEIQRVKDRLEKFQQLH